MRKILQIKNLCKSFDKLEVLKNINLDIYEGDVVVVIGPSGSGKSTLLRCISLLENITSGHILLNDKDVADSLEFHQKIGMVFQNFNLFENLTVLQNITLSPIKTKKLSKEDAVNKAKEAMMSTLIGIIIKLTLIITLSYLKIGLYSLIIATIVNIIYVTIFNYRKIKKIFN